MDTHQVACNFHLFSLTARITPQHDSQQTAHTRRKIKRIPSRFYRAYTIVLCYRICADTMRKICGKHVLMCLLYIYAMRTHIFTHIMYAPNGVVCGLIHTQTKCKSTQRAGCCGDVTIDFTSHEFPPAERWNGERVADSWRRTSTRFGMRYDDGATATATSAAS